MRFMCWPSDTRKQPVGAVAQRIRRLHCTAALLPPGDRCLRQWLTHEVIPLLRDRTPRCRLLQWQALERDVLHWQGQLWVPYGELPRLIGGQDAMTR